LNQLGDATEIAGINSTLTFTHGYGLALAEASRITSAGLPELLVRNAPVESADSQPQDRAAGNILRRTIA
jgi:uncharacterized membrane protein (UPF0182 family)